MTRDGLAQRLLWSNKEGFELKWVDAGVTCSVLIPILVSPDPVGLVVGNKRLVTTQWNSEWLGVTQFRGVDLFIFLFLCLVFVCVGPDCFHVCYCSNLIVIFTICKEF